MRLDGRGEALCGPEQLNVQYTEALNTFRERSVHRGAGRVHGDMWGVLVVGAPGHGNVQSSGHGRAHGKIHMCDFGLDMSASHRNLSNVI